jgi:hypothetical protein
MPNQSDVIAQDQLETLQKEVRACAEVELTVDATAKAFSGKCISADVLR